jgi:hypothetical protein
MAIASIFEEALFHKYCPLGSCALHVTVFGMGYAILADWSKFTTLAFL